MSNKITFPELAGLLAEKSGKSRKYCENFLRELFRVISDALVAGESVKIKGLGTFKLSSIEARKSVNVNTGEEFEIPGHSRVSFTPAKEIAEIINAPFEAFESIELADNLSDAELESDLDEIAVPSVVTSKDNNIAIDAPEETEPEEFEIDKEQEEPESEPEVDVESEPDVESEVEIVPEPKVEPESESEFEPKPKVEIEPEPEVEPQVQENVIDIPKPVTTVVLSRKRIFGSGFAAGIIFALVVGLIGFSVYRFCNRPTPTEVIHVADTTVKVTVVAPDSDSVKSALDDSVTVESVKPVENSVTEGVNMPETKVSDAPVYDMITKTRYLTTMARDHYGNYNLWPYIYEENKSFLGHPDRIRPGTKIVVPPLSKYGVNPNDPEEIEKAKKMGAEIYARYAK